ncbi:TPA: site-specific tyrosine recombinase XerD [Streptococcus pneumoniae]|uniref:Tyrosine recombinase XerD-like n=3 Tax=Streptococcus pneumoniae TaxID=1313 RepID=A0A6G2DUG5_STREE|nr:site-specific tyrosine recombinase XerD [Streptococcus pneumoniae]EHD55348.1 phage integrase, N-terminal SAM-like domain protein [Streptococcus pneumoniae NP070]EHZ24017.1 phage integrase, N-terminal SAM-like domain protein [Streptococcus pneumoniae GA14688]EHZ50570.1 phage integrase, N-terminal SAM-like domain protein [Streptococcus pneumoniae GA44128]EJG49125.1 phage integrase, N-terminal SAM-like domain protein [Streptococcus pneumoniae 2070768]EJG33479.1 phage integrase, N-terminal SAM-
MPMRDRISAFLEEKQGLSVNSKQSYKYDLEQFLDMVGERISETSLKIYQAQLANLKISVQKRKISACNQFLYFLYQKGEVDSFYRLELAKQAEKKTEKPEILYLDSFWQESDHPEGRLLALLILEMGLLPSEILAIKVADINLDFQVLRISKASQQRIVTIPTALLSELEPLMGQTYLFERGEKPYSRQWAFRQLESFVKEKGFPSLSAQVLREQFILRQIENKVDLYEIAKKLGLKTVLTLEKYR